ncbi:Uncharacterised protein [uncultured archaeon]|nr:Uncharacterised protein [uncultured archaeon]
MKEINKNRANEMNLKLIGRVGNSDFSKLILLIERLKENKNAMYYAMDLILYNQDTEKGEYHVSFWGE